MTPTPLDADALIDGHPQAALIRCVQRTAYRAYSTRHKVGLDALSWLAGPLAPVGFIAVDQHRSTAHQECLQAVVQLAATFTGSVEDRRIVALLLDGYPGRSYAVASRLQAVLNPQLPSDR